MTITLLVVVLWNLPTGKDFLPKVTLHELQRLYEAETKGKPRSRLLCAIHRKEGESLDEISDSTKLKRRTVHAILQRFVERGISAKDHRNPKGRPPKLNEKERSELIEQLEKGPPRNRKGLWTTRQVRDLIWQKFKVKYSKSHVWELLGAAGFSIQKPRPRNYKAPSNAEKKRFKKKLQCWQRSTGRKGTR